MESKVSLQTYSQRMGFARAPFAVCRSSPQFPAQRHSLRAPTPHAHQHLFSRRNAGAVWHILSAATPIVCKSTGTDGSTSTAPRDTDERIKTTLADLDALLGIQEEPSPEEFKVGIAHACRHPVMLVVWCTVGAWMLGPPPPNT